MFDIFPMQFGYLFVIEQTICHGNVQFVQIDVEWVLVPFLGFVTFDSEYLTNRHYVNRMMMVANEVPVIAIMASQI